MKTGMQLTSDTPVSRQPRRRPARPSASRPAGRRRASRRRSRAAASRRRPALVRDAERALGRVVAPCGRRRRRAPDPSAPRPRTWRCWSLNTVVQLGGAKTASCSGRPTLRASTSKAATTSTSLGPVAAHLEVHQPHASCCSRGHVPVVARCPGAASWRSCRRPRSRSSPCPYRSPPRARSLGHATASLRSGLRSGQGAPRCGTAARAARGAATTARARRRSARPASRARDSRPARPSRSPSGSTRRRRAGACRRPRPGSRVRGRRTRRRGARRRRAPPRRGTARAGRRPRRAARA